MTEWEDDAIMAAAQALIAPRLADSINRFASTLNAACLVRVLQRVRDSINNNSHMPLDTKTKAALDASADEYTNVLSDITLMLNEIAGRDIEGTADEIIRALQENDHGDDD